MGSSSVLERMGHIIGEPAGIIGSRVSKNNDGWKKVMDTNFRILGVMIGICTRYSHGSKREC